MTRISKMISSLASKITRRWIKSAWHWRITGSEVSHRPFIAAKRISCSMLVGLWGAVWTSILQVWMLPLQLALVCYHSWILSATLLARRSNFSNLTPSSWILTFSFGLYTGWIALRLLDTLSYRVSKKQTQSSSATMSHLRILQPRSPPPMN